MSQSNGPEIKLTLNGQPATLAGSSDMPLMYALRDQAGLRGARYGCGVGQCGSCAVIVDGKRVSSCEVLLGDVEGATVTTIEGHCIRRQPASPATGVHR